MKTKLIISFLLGLGCSLTAQPAAAVRADSLPQGAWARMEIEVGDTVFVMSLRPVRISGKRQFKDLVEQRQYFLYFRAAKRVYPYALQAIALYREIEEESQGMSKNKRRRMVRREHSELKEDFKDQMKNLSKTEGKVLIKMIESQVGRPFYDVIRDTRGGFTASYWHNLGKVWGYDLKAGYVPGADPLLDEVFLDYDFGNPFK